MLTINRQICEPFLYPPDKEAETQLNQERSLARIACEICERLEEMEEIRCMSSGTFIGRLSSARVISPKAYRIAIQLMHGNLESLRSYAKQAEIRGISRQTVFLEFRNELAKIEHVFPDLVATMRDLHDKALRHEDPSDQNDAMRRAMYLS